MCQMTMELHVNRGTGAMCQMTRHWSNVSNDETVKKFGYFFSYQWSPHTIFRLQLSIQEKWFKFSFISAADKF